ncbi:hypothetical protein F5Y16DRAFT_355818 [Xylariaceae sp. FL0255]|nr:hypothetical protein F5Y16DRAFT_355818 [Xylariaceae sp. FL0255]
MKLQRAIPKAQKSFNAFCAAKSQNPALLRALSSSAISNSSYCTTVPTPRTPSSCLTSSPRNNSQFILRQGRKTYASSPSPDNGPLNKTALYDLHIAHGAKMVPFGGFEMPVLYAGLSVSESHHFTRQKSSLFDVGHMVQHRFEGPGATAFLQSITPASLESLPAHQSTLSALLWPETGGIVDDTVVTRLGPECFYVVTNAACREKDLKYLSEQLARWDGAEVRHETLDGWGLVALQGPLSAEVLGRVLADPEAANLNELYFGQSRFAKLQGGEQDVLISRGGYTGEDGFEISIAPADTVSVTEALLAAGGQDVAWAGLGARDSLRLEAGMCLYGHDLDDTTTPVEGGLAWIVGKDRRAPGSFHGADVIVSQLTPKSKGGSGVSRRRVGLVIERGAPAREGAEIVDGASGEKIGVVTSGCPSPTLGQNIAMGYVKDGLHKVGTEINVLVRGKPRKAVVTKMPFVPSKYWKGTAPA